MTLFVYITDSCADDAQSHGMSDDLQRFKDKVEATQSTSLFDPFPWPYKVKKKLGGRQGRLVAEQRNIGEHSVVVFLGIMIRGHREYQEFSDNPKTYAQSHFLDRPTDEQLAAFVEERTRTTPASARPAPSDAEYSLLYGAFAHRNDAETDVLVCETDRWVEAVGQDRITKQLSKLHPACFDALGKAAGLHFVPVKDKPGWGIWALRTEDRLLLITPVTEAAPEIEEYARRCAAELESADRTGILRRSRRAYPALVLYDDDLWIDLERETEANMALSPEESEVLESARRSPHPFPLFINGRAGSGKSTILQYLFADLLYSYLTNPDAREIAPPVYLTANSELLRTARQFVEKLLRSEATFAQRALTWDDSRVTEVLDDAFKEFYGYLREQFPVNVQKDRFAKANRVDFARFRSLWTARFGKERTALRDYGPDLSWHIIRSYIKGMSSESESFLEPQDYAQLPENQRTVTEEAYALVYERVWSGWYRDVLEASGLWDDQDLTRFVLDGERASPVHPAVFCDEAQDFTRIELEFLLRINLFSGRTLPPTDLGRVCFAFAGDQFQTLNPTGFRWDAIKATFVEKFIFELDAGRQVAGSDLNYRELQFNYRSSDKIVRFGNHVQAMRAALFELPDLKPQTPWTTEKQAFPVTWFRAGDAAFWERFREIPGIVVIVPCHEGEEAAFVGADEFLSRHIRVEDGVPQNVLSASRAKGCEYPVVIAYGFGEAGGVDIMAEFATGSETAEPNPEETLPLQYFVNRLYVAVSRPKRRLIIVDSDRGIETLWKAATEEAAEEAMLSRLKKGREIWSPAIEGMMAGNAADLGRDDAVAPVDIARAFEREGLARCDAFMMKQAAQAYRGAQEIAKAKECAARAKEFDGELLEAGRAFVEAGRIVPDGVRCLWLAGEGGWQDLMQLPLRAPQAASEIEVQFAQLLWGKPTVASAIEFLKRLSLRLEVPSFVEQSVGSVAWRLALERLIKALLGLPTKGQIKDEWQQLSITLGRLSQQGMSVPPIDAASVCYIAGRYADAVRLWDDAGSTRSVEYMRAKSRIEPYPKRVASLAALKLWDEIVREYDSAQDSGLSAEQAVHVVAALREVGRAADACAVAWKMRSPEALFRLAIELREATPDLASKALYGAVFALVEQGSWDQINAILLSSGFRPVPEWSSEGVEGWFSAQRERVLATIVRGLARSSKLEEAPESFLRRWSEFLRKNMHSKDGPWREHLTLAEAGAALERAGRYTDALVFYEAIRGHGVSEDEIAFAKQRWLVTKNRQLQHERAQRESGRTRQIEREIQQVALKLKIRSIEDLDPYPVLPDIDDPGATAANLEAATAGAPKGAQHVAEAEHELQQTLPDRVGVVLGQFELLLGRGIGRLNITNKETMETAFFKLATREFGGDVACESTGEGRWKIPTWNLSIELSATTPHRISVRTEALGAVVKLNA
jgi:tetratricopeptide (TPR) repeat protein